MEEAISLKDMLPYAFFTYGGKYSGTYGKMRYMIKREGEKPDFILCAYVWRGPLAFEYVQDEEKSKETFSDNEEGKLAAIEWINKEYNDRVEEWNQAKAIIDVDID